MLSRENKWSFPSLNNYITSLISVLGLFLLITSANTICITLIMHPHPASVFPEYELALYDSQIID